MGRARDRRPGRDRLDRARALADAGVVLRDDAGRAPARHLQHGARPAGLLPGDARRRSRRLPPHRARAAGRTRRRRARAARVPPRRQVAQSGARLRRLSPRAHAGGARDRSDRVLRRCPAKDWAVDGSRSGTGKSRGVTSLGVEQGRPARDGPRGQGAVHRHEDSVHGTRGTRRDRAACDDAETDRRRVRLAGEVREVRDRSSCAKPVTASATSARSRLWPFPYDAVAEAASGPDVRRVGSFELVGRADDRRRAHRRRPGARPSRSSAASRPTTRGSASGASSTSRSSPNASSRCTKTASFRSFPATSSSRTSSRSTTAHETPSIDTSVSPIGSAPARSRS